MKKQLTDAERKCRDRIIELIETRCGGSQQVFADRANIGKSSVSQYVNGTNTPGNVTAGKIASAFNVNPAWIMGFDAPMVTEPGNEEDDYYINEEARRLADAMHKDPRYQVLFDASRKVKPEDIEKVKQMIDLMRSDYDGDDPA